jgi:hypothetical protein
LYIQSLTLSETPTGSELEYQGGTPCPTLVRDIVEDRPFSMSTTRLDKIDVELVRT